MAGTNLNLSADEVLVTTRSVRKRLDLDRPVEPEVIRECLEVALQAPSGSNAQGWQFVVVTDPSLRQGIADVYRRAFAIYRTMPVNARDIYTGANAERRQTQDRVMGSAEYLASIMERVPVHVLPCIAGRLDSQPPIAQASTWGSIMPAAWSFMLAARNRGLGSSWTSLHLMFEQEVADIVGIPYAEWSQAVLIPVGYTKGTDFKPARREPLGSVLHWDHW